MGIPPKVRGTALTYFHRFYLHHSVMDAEPKSIMMAAVYVACKTEEHYIAAEDLARMAKQDPSIVLREELNLLNGINFDLIVHHPYRPLLGIQFLLHDLGGAAAGGDARGERGGGGDAHPFASTREGREETMRRARHAADAAMMTDAPLLFAPGLLALACFRLALREELSEERARSGFLLMARALRGQADDQQERTAAFLGALEAESAAEPGPCLAVLDDIEAYVRDGRAPVDQEAVREIDRQLKGCRNPVRNKDAEHYKRVHAKKFEVRRRRPRGPSIRCLARDRGGRLAVGAARADRRARVPRFPTAGNGDEAAAEAGGEAGGARREHERAGGAAAAAGGVHGQEEEDGDAVTPPASGLRRCLYCLCVLLVRSRPSGPPYCALRWWERTDVSSVTRG